MLKNVRNRILNYKISNKRNKSNCANRAKELFYIKQVEEVATYIKELYKVVLQAKRISLIEF